MNQDRSMNFYVANLGSEVQRMFGWREKGDNDAMQNAYQRIVIIIERIKEFGNKNANIEMDVLKKILSSIVVGGSEYLIDKSQISEYFNPFAL